MSSRGATSRRSSLTLLLLFGLGPVVLAQSAARKDHYGDPLPPGAIDRLGSQRLLHAGAVRYLSFTPDGKVLVSASADGTIRWWRVTDGRELRRLKLYPSATALAPDGTTITVGTSAGMLHHLDLASGAEQWKAQAHQGEIGAVGYTADSQRVASVGMDGVTWLWDAGNGKARQKLVGQPGRVQAAVFAPDGKTLAIAASDRTIRLWDLGGGKERAVLKGHQDPATAIAFTPNGKVLLSAGGTAAAGGGDNAVRLWDTASGDLLVKLPVPARFDRVPSFAFATDGKTLALAGALGDIDFLDVTTGHASKQSISNPDWIQSLAYSADGKTLALGHGNGRIRLWDPKVGKDRLAPHPTGMGAGLVSFSPDGTALAAGRRDAFTLYELWTGRNLEGQLEEGAHGILSPNGAYLAGPGWHASTSIWQVATGKRIAQLSNQFTHAISFSPDGKQIASAENDGKVCLWESATGKLVRELVQQGFQPINCSVHQVAFAPDGQSLASVTWFTSPKRDTALHLWDPATGKERWWIEPDGIGRIYALAYSPDSKTLYTASGAGIISLWNVAEGKATKRLARLQRYIGAMAVSPDGGTLALVQDKSVVLWSVASNQKIRRLEGHQAPISRVAFSPDATVLATSAQDSTVLVWDLASPTDWKVEMPKALARQELSQLWDELASTDLAVAYRAARILAAVPDLLIPLCRKHIKPDPTQEQVQRLITDLDSQQFDVRDTATRRLQELGWTAAPALHLALGANPPLEVRRRIEQLLGSLKQDPPSKAVSVDGEILRALRLVAILEKIGSEQARSVLQIMARGMPSARTTFEAKGALERRMMK